MISCALWAALSLPVAAEEPPLVSDDEFVNEMVIVELYQGEPITGFLVSREPSGQIQLMLGGGSLMTFGPHEYRSIQLELEPVPLLRHELTGELVVVELHHGRELTGILLSRDSLGGLVLELPSGSQVTFEPTAYRSMRSAYEEPLEILDAPEPEDDGPNRDDWLGDPSASRYFYGLSALSLEQGQVSAAQKQLLFTEAAYGVTDQWDVQLATCIFCWNGSAVLDTATSYSFPIRDGLYVAIRGRVLFMYRDFLGGTESDFLGAFGSGAVTWGDDRSNLSASVGAGREYTSELGMPVFVSVSGVLRVLENVSLMTENWLMLGPQIYTGTNALAVPMGGARFIGERALVDVGLTTIPLDGEEGMTQRLIPWLGVTYHFYDIYRVETNNPYW